MKHTTEQSVLITADSISLFIVSAAFWSLFYDELFPVVRGALFVSSAWIILNFILAGFINRRINNEK